MDTIQIDGWQGRLGQGLAPRQLLATIYAAKDMTMKEIARCMDCAPSTAKKTLDRARFNLSEDDRPIRTVRGLCLEAVKRGIIAPLMVALLVGGEHSQIRPIRRPDAPRQQTLTRVKRVDEVELVA
ncbi:helix-turn-helix transcriptional regulator [Stutzerimonas nitrititolerans]|uniref:helix-turn-helix transcriptional regulator n=1 Tax=Stutzerimonas nitrititolerans TaxID=2482751 RepID=UPI0028A97F83|nr:helix-turn-helix transcriptional regulator [Stutzerimonas nitrititolerans]